MGDVQVVGITTRRGGALVAQNPEQGVDLRRAVLEMQTNRQFSQENPNFAPGMDSARACAG